MAPVAPVPHQLMRWTLLAVGLLTVSCGNDVPPPRTAPSLLLVTLDTTRRDALGAYSPNSRLTPNIDQLAGEGVVFLEAHTQVPITLVSHTSMLTGLGVLEHGVRENGTFVVADAVTTLAEVLTKEGYATAAFVSSFVLAERFGLSQGFGTYDAEMTGGKKKHWQGHSPGHFERRANDTTDRALAWLDEQRGSSQPFFLWVHYFDPHAPYNPPEDFRAPGRHPYASEIAFTDSEFGRLWQKVREVEEHLLTVIATDHGESLGEHGIGGHGQDLFEAALAAGLIFHWPAKLPMGVRVRTGSQLKQVAPTVRELLRLPSDSLSGTSLVPAIDAAVRRSAPHGASPVDRPNRKPLYIETLLPGLRGSGRSLRGIILDRWKLIIPDGDAPPWLFDLKKDPAEIKNVAQTEPETVARLRAAFDTLVETTTANAPAISVEMGCETFEQLRALGYTADGAQPPAGCAD